MALIECHQCKVSIADDAATCPQCGTATQLARQHQANINQQLESASFHANLQGCLFGVVGLIFAILFLLMSLKNAGLLEP